MSLSTGPEVQMLNVANFHKEMIKLAGESIERYPSRERDISSLTLSIQREKVGEIKKRIISFRRKLLEMACSDELVDQVIQMNFQLFPLTKPYKKEIG